MSEPEYLGARIALERSLFDNTLGHCEYSLARACLDWETGSPDAGRGGFKMALSFCDDRIMAKRGEVAAALHKKDFGEAFAAWQRNTEGNVKDSLALVSYEPVVFAGLSLSGYTYEGPEAYRLPKNDRDPIMAWRLSFLPGAGFLYVGEPKVAASHFILSTVFASLCGYSAWRGYTAVDRDARMVAWMDFGLVATLFLQRYYLGGIREAHRLAQVKNQKAGLEKVSFMLESLNPFGIP